MKSKVVMSLSLFLFVMGSSGLYDLFNKSNEMEHNVGVVTHLGTERTYHH